MDQELDNGKSDAEVQMLEQFECLKQENKKLDFQCKRLQSLLDQITCSNDNQRFCECGRKLRYISTEFKKIEQCCRKCNVKLIEVSNVWWNCPSCAFSVCAKCEGYKKSVCPFSHFIQFTKLNVDIDNQEQGQNEGLGVKKNHICHICLKTIDKHYYSCTCQFAMCKECRQVGS